MDKKKMTCEEAIKKLELASGSDFYTADYQDAITLAIEALKEKEKRKDRSYVNRQLNLVVSVLPKTDGVCDRIEETHELSNKIAKFLHEMDYKFVIAGEDMMSDIAKEQIAKIE